MLLSMAMLKLALFRTVPGSVLLRFHTFYLALAGRPNLIIPNLTLPCTMSRAFFFSLHTLFTSLTSCVSRAPAQLDFAHHLVMLS